MREQDNKMQNSRQERLLEIFFRCLKGEALYVQKLADEYHVSTKSITRNINDLKAFLVEHRELMGNAELQYSHQNKSYYLQMDELLSNKELFALLKVVIGTRAFSKIELLSLTEKLKRCTTKKDKAKLNQLIRKELYHYTEVKHDCDSVQDLLWQLADYITEKQEITIEYYRMDRKCVEHRICPASLMFSDHYFYLIAFDLENMTKPLYFRIDRIKQIVQHRKKSETASMTEFDEGLLRKRSLFMWPGKLRTIRFLFTGPSVQAVLDKLPTAKIIEGKKGAYILEAEVYGDGIKMWLLSQGSWVKVLEPSEFVAEMKEEVQKMYALYE